MAHAHGSNHGGHDHGDHNHGHGHGDHGHGHGGHDHGDPILGLIKLGWQKISPSSRRKQRNYRALAAAITRSDNMDFAALLDNGADFRFTPKKAQSIITLCLENGTPDMLQHLMQHGLEPNEQVPHHPDTGKKSKKTDIVSDSCPLLSHAIEAGRTDMAMALLADTRIDTTRTGVTVKSEPRGYRLQFHPYPLDLARAFNMARVARKLAENKAPSASGCPAKNLTEHRKLRFNRIS